MIDRERLRRSAAKLDFELTFEQLEKLDVYSHLLVEWNAHTNLTAITEPEEIEQKHFLDCMLAAKACEDAGSVIDVGTGAGFPGMVIAIMRPELDVTLMDSLEKRLRFLDELARKTGVSCKTLHSRAEDAGHLPELRERFDRTTARAVAPLNILCEYLLPLTAVGGRMLAMKGKMAAAELEQATKAIKSLGGELADTKEYTLPCGDSRTIIVIEKSEPTDARFPRKPAQIKKKPL